MPRGNNRFARYVDLYLGRSLYLHWQRTSNYKTLRFDFVIGHPLKRPDSAYLALVGRLCERGTRQLPDMQSLNRAADNLYGAYYAVDVHHRANRQFLHVVLELLDPRFVEESEREWLLLRGLDLVRQIAMEPLAEGNSYKRSYLEQEKRALAAQMDSLYNDKMAYAQWRCAREMADAEGVATSMHIEDVAAVDGLALWKFQSELMRSGEIHFYASGRLDSAQLSTIAEQVQSWRRVQPDVAEEVACASGKRRQRRVFEWGDVAQSRLVCGYGVAVPSSAKDFARLLLFNALWGGESPSLLFRRLREELGLCYQIDSQIDSMAGRAFVLAGIDRQDYSRILVEIERVLGSLADGKVDGDVFEQGQALLLHRLETLSEDRDALVRMSVRSHVAHIPIAVDELLDCVQGLSTRDIAIAARQITFSMAYMLHGHPPVETANL